MARAARGTDDRHPVPPPLAGKAARFRRHPGSATSLSLRLASSGSRLEQPGATQRRGCSHRGRPQAVGGRSAIAGGQAAAIFPPGSLQPSAAASQIRLRLEPVTDPPEPPKGYSIVGNVYRVLVIEEPTQAQLGLTKPYQLTMEIPPGPFDVLQLYDGTNWQ